MDLPEGGILLLVSKGEVVTAWADLFQVTVFAKLLA